MGDFLKWLEGARKRAYERKVVFTYCFTQFTTAVPNELALNVENLPVEEIHPQLVTVVKNIKEMKKTVDVLRHLYSKLHWAETLLYWKVRREHLRYLKKFTTNVDSAYVLMESITNRRQANGL